MGVQRGEEGRGKWTKKAMGGVDTVEKRGREQREREGRHQKRVIMLHISEIMKFAF